MTVWTTTDFAGWMSRNGLRLIDAADVLKLTLTSVKRIKSGQQALTARTQVIAEGYEKARTIHDDDLAMAAETMDIADLCDAVPFGVVSGLTAASMMGWTTASTHVRHVALPEHFAARKQPDRVIALPCALLPTEVSLATDRDGRHYRIATPLRIVLDCVRHDDRQVVYHVEEVVRSALKGGLREADMRDLADRFGGRAPERLAHYVSLTI